MLTTLLDQVLQDEPEGASGSDKGWEVPVYNLVVNGGPQWRNLKVRTARNNVRDAVSAWARENRNSSVLCHYPQFVCSLQFVCPLARKSQSSMQFLGRLLL